MSKIIERFKNEKMVVNCRTEEQAKEFIGICYDNGLHWFNSGVEVTNWESEGQYTCYRAECPEIMYASVQFYVDEDYTVITFDEFMEEYRGMKQFTKADLKSGMIVVLRHGDERVVVKDITTVWTEEEPYDTNHNTNDIIVNGITNSWEYLDNYNDDLTNAGGYNAEDIMEVYLAPHPYCMQDFKYEYEKRKLLWEREEVKELTVEEISELLGYKVRVVGGKD